MNQLADALWNIEGAHRIWADELYPNGYPRVAAEILIERIPALQQELERTTVVQADGRELPIDPVSFVRDKAAQRCLVRIDQALSNGSLTMFDPVTQTPTQQRDGAFVLASEVRAMMRQGVAASNESSEAAAPKALARRGDIADLPAAHGPAPQGLTPRFSVPKRVLVKRHKPFWPSIEADLKDASKNGLAEAKAGARDWYEATAVDWAMSRGKYRTEPLSGASTLDQVMRGMASLPTMRHKLQG